MSRRGQLRIKPCTEPWWVWGPEWWTTLVISPRSAPCLQAVLLNRFPKQLSQSHTPTSNMGQLRELELLPDTCYHLPSYWEWISTSWWFEFAFPWWLMMLMWGGLFSTWTAPFAKLPVRTFAPFYTGWSIFFSLIGRGYSYFLHSFHVRIYCKYLLCTLSLS